MQEKINYTIKPDDVTDELILRRCKSLKDAIRLCRDCSPFADDEILFEIEKRTGRKIQKSHFSESLNADRRNFPPELIQTLEDICGNWLPTRYMALSRNQELKPKKEALEIELDKAHAEKEELMKKLNYFEELIKKVKL